MIPHRVRLKGFLCYKEEQTIDFGGNATLWMLAGLNGSGKSAIFDAVTYALFGHHRGGGRDNHELINKDSDSMLVEFDFLLDGKEYRAKRTLKRDTKGGARGTQQMFRWDSSKWEAIEGTSQKREFDAWISDSIGLSYDTFTSSVLLLQGKADKLLDSKPEGRREVLASIVDLERYERLHQKADERRKSLEGALKSLTSRLAALPAVAPLELAAAREAIRTAEEQRAAARAEVQRLHDLEIKAQAWHELCKRLDVTRQRWQKAKTVLTEAAAIEAAVERLRALREILPRLHEITLLRGQAFQAEEQITRLGSERQRKEEELSTREASLRQTQSRLTTAQNQIEREENQFREIAARLRDVRVQLETLNQCERQEVDLDRLREELRRLPPDPHAQLDQARVEFDRLEGLARVIPILTRLRTRREELGRAIEKEQAVEHNQQSVRARGEAKKAEADALRPRLEEASQAVRHASDQATEARTLLAQAKESLQELSHLDGAKVCRHCGQGLTPGHIAEEKKRRSKDVQQAQARFQSTADALAAARQVETELSGKLTKTERRYQELREEYREGLGHLKQAKADVERLRQDCTDLHSDLPEAFRNKVGAAPISDWLATSYPTPADLETLRAQTRGLEAARRNRVQAEEVVNRHSQLKAKETQALENLTRMLRDLPSDRQALRQENADLEAKEKALFGSIDAGRAQVKEIDREVRRLIGLRDESQRAVNDIATQLKEHHLVIQNAQRGIAAQLKLLPEGWHAQAEKMGIRELHLLRSEKDDLEARDTDEQARMLEWARRNLAVVEQDVKDLEVQEANTAPEARQDLSVLAQHKREANYQDQRQETQLADTRQHLKMLETYQEQRAQIDEEYRNTEKELTTHRLLAELLGRERLQLYLVRQAERQVVEYANAVLDRLSGGQLYLRLSGEADGEGASAKALDLEAYNRATGERPINVAFLSGSQKFRVAVSLALGIGQYASRQHRPIESVIIDEGFGCLDSQGRQVMIQELQNLRSQMRCILLVSHQEDFAESFSDGYHFELQDGATRVKRFQK
jgi:exonuclease SbcC